MSESKQIAPIEQLRGTIQQMEPQFKAALPKHISTDKFIRVVMTAIQQTPDLVRADRTSLLGACVKSASDGLLPDGREAAIVTFGGKAQYMPMVAGICKKARNSGDVATLGAHIIYKNDHFRFWVDADGEHLEHEPVLFGDKGEMLGAYAIAKLKDGSVMVEPLPLDEIEKIRNTSKAKNGPAWKDWFTEMAKKSAIRRLAKYRLPSSSDLLDTVKVDDDLFMPDTPAATPEKPVKTKPAKLAKLVGGTEDLPKVVIESEDNAQSQEEEYIDRPAALEVQAEEEKNNIDASEEHI